MKTITHLCAGIAIGVSMTALSFSIASEVNTAPEAVQQSPQYYNVLLENDHVRVYEYRLKPGEKEPMHSHTAGVVYGFADVRLRTTFPDGHSEEIAGHAGETHWREPLTHALENIGTTEVHALVVEPKVQCGSSSMQ